MYRASYGFLPDAAYQTLSALNYTCVDHVELIEWEAIIATWVFLKYTVQGNYDV